MRFTMTLSLRLKLLGIHAGSAAGGSLRSAVGIFFRPGVVVCR